MAGNITTLAAQVVVKDNTADGMAKVQAALNQQAKTMERTLSNPIAEADRQLQSLINSTTKLANKSNFQILSDREVDKLKQVSVSLDGIMSRLGMAGGASIPGFDTIARNVQQMQQLVSQSQQLRMMPANPINTIGTTSRFIPNSQIGMPEGFRPIGSFIGGQDIDHLFGRQRSIRNAADAVIRGHRTDTDFQNQAMGYGQFSTISPARQRFNEGNAQSRRVGEFENILRAEDQTVARLTDRWAKLTAEQQKNVNFRIQARSRAGFDTELQQRAMQNVVDPFSQFNLTKSGRGSTSHALQFGTQNAAFALEDFLISSQYGGVKAGLRAMTNNLTAIAAASTGMLGPAASGGIIAATAIGGALMPSIYDYATGNRGNRTFARVGPNNQRIETTNMEAELEGRVDFQSKYRSFQRNIYRTSGVREAGQSFQSELDEMSDLRERRQRLENQRDFGVPFGLYGQAADDFRIGIEKELAALPTLEEQGLRVNRASTQYGRLRQYAPQDRALADRHAGESFELERRVMNGEMVNPNETYALRRKQLGESYAINRRRATTDIERTGVDENHADQMAALSREEVRATEEYNLSVRNRGFQHRLRLADFEIDPRKKLAEQVAVQREKIRADKSLTPDQQTAELAGLEKAYKRDLRTLGDYPGAGDAINVGSAEDVRLRQKFFNRDGSGGGESEAQKELKRIVDEIRGLRDDIKKSAPRPANFKKK